VKGKGGVFQSPARTPISGVVKATFATLKVAKVAFATLPFTTLITAEHRSVKTSLKDPGSFFKSGLLELFSRD